MYVTVDRKELMFVHKTNDVDVACSLAFIELRHNPYSIEPITAVNWLNDFSDGELRKLYENTTGQKTNYLGPFLKAILCELACRLPETVANEYCVELQAGKLNENSPYGYQYIHNEVTPAITGYVPSPLRAERRADEAAIGTAGASYYAQAVTSSNSAGGPVAHAQAAPAATVAPKRARAASSGTGARSNGQRGGIIWEVADRLWNEEGCPTSKSELLNLRRRIMDVLEQAHGVKRTTSSTSLGGWQKTKEI